MPLGSVPQTGWRDVEHLEQEHSFWSKHGEGRSRGIGHSVDNRRSSIWVRGSKDRVVTRTLDWRQDPFQQGLSRAYLGCHILAGFPRHC